MFSLLNEAILQMDMYLAPVGFIWCLIIIGHFIMHLIKAIRAFVIPRLIPPDLTFYGEWAVVTGGSSGIGKSYARRLANRGMNIVIISNELEALKSTANEIESEYGVKCYYINADFTKDKGIFERVMRELRDKDVGILVNGAGIIGKMPCYFLKETENDILAMIDLHIGSVVNMTLHVLPLMLGKKKGVIVNISSLASLFPMPFISIYSSCKAFSDRFSRALSWEYNRNYYNYLRFQSLTPSLINTKLVMKSNTSSFFKSLSTNCETFTASSVGTITVVDQTTGYWIHGIIKYLMELLPTIVNQNFQLRKRSDKNILKIKKN